MSTLTQLEERVARAERLVFGRALDEPPADGAARAGAGETLEASAAACAARLAALAAAPALAGFLERCWCRSMLSLLLLLFRLSPPILFNWCLCPFIVDWYALAMHAHRRSVPTLIDHARRASRDA
jgi:hypothetical protein